MKNKKGFSLVEVVLAVAMFSLGTSALIGAIIYGQETSGISDYRVRATYLASEGIEALRNIQNQNFSSLADGTYGFSASFGQWELLGTPDVTEGFTRQAVISTLDENTKQAKVSVSWQQNLQRDGLVELDTYLTNWRASSLKNGMLVYADSSDGLDRIRYKIFDQNSESWSEAKNTADVDSTGINRQPRAMSLYSSSVRNEKILLSRHYDGTRQYIYAQVFDGDNWGDVNLLASWSGNTFLDVQNFDGVYLGNGNFMAIYSDNSSIPKSKIWDGSSWGSEKSLKNLGGGAVSNFIVAKRRVGSDEIMTAFLTQKSTIVSEYYNGSSWSSATTHASSVPSNAKRAVDFVWSPNLATSGALFYASGTTAATRSVYAKIWSANGSGGGSWGNASTSSVQSNAVGAVAGAGKKGANEFQVCDKDSAATPKIYCYRVLFSGNVVSFSMPTNSEIASATDSGIQRSYHLDFETSGEIALAAYSDNTGTPKFKKYNPLTNTWDQNATSFGTASYSPDILKTFRTVPYPENDDILILMADGKQDLYSVFWNGGENSPYSSGERGFFRHGTSGSNDTDFWFDFSWDGI